MKTYLSKLLAFVCAFGLATGVQAADQLNGNDIFVTGEPSELGAWTPGHDAGFQVRDDGLNGDAVADDGIFSLDLTLTPTAAGYFPWKMASSGWSFEVPKSFDSSRLNFPDTASQTIKFLADTNVQGDGFIPDIGNPDGYVGILYTIPSALDGQTTWSLVGSFQSEIGPGGDWETENANTLMNDAGINGDAAAADGIFTLQLTGLPAGSYECLMVSNQNYDNPIVRSNGMLDNGNNIGFDVLSTSDTLTFELDTDRGIGRYRITNDNSAVNPGPPFYAISDSFGTSLLNDDSVLFDDGTNGDVVSGDGIYSRQFTVAAPETTHSLKIRQGLGPDFPETGDGYPFVTSTADQLVLVQFDTNDRSADGFTPSTNYVWTDPASRRTPASMHATGDFLVDFGASANWTNDDAFFALNDTGADGDAAAGDGLWAKSFTNGARAGSFMKATGPTGSWQYQYGGQNNGYTVNGNNPDGPYDIPANCTIIVDAVTGRFGVQDTATPGIDRPATINALPETPNAAHGWAIYE